jgi:hypothetical protein
MSEVAPYEFAVVADRPPVENAKGGPGGHWHIQSRCLK